MNSKYHSNFRNGYDQDDSENDSVISERKFMEEVNKKYQPIKEEDKELILKEYKVSLNRLEKE